MPSTQASAGRKFLARLIAGRPSKRVTVALSAALALTLVAAAFGLGALSKSVIVSLDGKDTEVRALGSTVADVLESQNITSASMTPSLLDSTIRWPTAPASAFGLVAPSR